MKWGTSSSHAPAQHHAITHDIFYHTLQGLHELPQKLHSTTTTTQRLLHRIVTSDRHAYATKIQMILTNPNAPISVPHVIAAIFANRLTQLTPVDTTGSKQQCFGLE